VTFLPDTVLLVEDAPDLGPLLQETLEEWNHRALLARTAAEAMEVLAREPVALMLLDHQLPDMSAPELLSVLRSERRSIPPVVLMTAWLQPEPHEQLPELVGVLRKPFDLSDLRAVVRRHLPRR
jgi:two-component system KDP operon response regulator KdpE